MVLAYLMPKHLLLTSDGFLNGSFNGEEAFHGPDHRTAPVPTGRRSHQ
jgi:hypothetical protein